MQTGPVDPQRVQDDRHALLHDLQERIKEATAIHETARLIQDDRMGTQLILERIAALVPPAMQFPDVAAARATYGGLSVCTPGFAESAQSLSRAFRTRDGVDGTLDVIYTCERPAAAEGPFLLEERQLIDSMAGMIAATIDRRVSDLELKRRAGQLEALSRKLIEAQEAERRALSHELHDDLGQMLFALKLNLEQTGQADSESMALVEGAIARMRALVQALRPPLLDELGLESSLRWYVEREATRAGLAFQLALGPLGRRPPITTEITCFRVAQEALSNIIRHAQATRVEIELAAAGNALLLSVRDDGRGFDVAVARARAATGSSQGLLSMQERVALVGGDFAIESTLGKGTSVRARLPVTPSRPELSLRDG
jgi:signal transduction histidine kinase